MKNKIIVGGVLIIIVLLVVFLTGNKSESSTIKIGVSLPLTGEIASFGDTIVAGIDYAVDEVNKSGGVDGRQIEVIYEDDSCSDAGATVFNKLININKVDVIVGPLCSPSSAAGLPIAEKSKVPVVFWGSAAFLTGLGDYGFRTYPSDSLQGVAAAKYMFDEMGVRNVALLHVNNDWGIGLQEVFVKEFKALGGNVVALESALPSSIDVRTSLSKIKSANPEAIYMPVFPQTGIAALQQLKNLGITVPVVGGDSFNAPEVAAVPEAEGMVIVMSKIGENKELNEKIKAFTGKDPGLYTPYGYDAIKLLAEVFGKVGTDKEKVKEYLYQVKYENAVANPTISFDEAGDLKDGEAAIFVIKDKKIVPLVR